MGVAEATNNYRESVDTFKDFLDGMDDVPEDSLDMHREPLRSLYNMWAQKNGVPKLNTRQFKAKMLAHGWEVVTQDHVWRLNKQTADDNWATQLRLSRDLRPRTSAPDKVDTSNWHTRAKDC